MVVERMRRILLAIGLSQSKYDAKICANKNQAQQKIEREYKASVMKSF
jgi:hypothetical protein